MKEKRVETIAWVLIYSGLLLASLGAFLRHDTGIGWVLVGVGAAEAVAGAVLIVVRARMKS
jgi:hypothetical protein